MKTRIMLYGTFCLCAILAMACAPAKEAPVSPVEKNTTTLPGGIEVGPYGNLVGLKNAQGEPFFGKNASAPFDGYAIAYRIGEMRLDLNDVQVVHAVQNHITKDKLSVQSGAAAQSVVVNTLDGALLITNLFSLNEKDGKLEVTRTVKNISSQQVSLIAFEIQTDPRFSRYREPAKVKFKLEELRSPLDAELILPLGGKDLPCDKSRMPCPQSLTDSDCSRLREEMETVTESSSSAPSIFQGGRIPGCLLINPKFCREFQRLITRWVAGITLPPCAFAAGQAVSFKMVYYVRQ